MCKGQQDRSLIDSPPNAWQLAEDPNSLDEFGSCDELAWGFRLIAALQSQALELERNGWNLNDVALELDWSNTSDSRYDATGQDIPSDTYVPPVDSLFGLCTSTADFDAFVLQLSGLQNPEYSEDLTAQPPDSGHAGGYHYDDPNSTQTFGYRTAGHRTANDNELVVCDFTEQCKLSFPPSAGELQRHIKEHHPELKYGGGNKIVECPCEPGKTITTTNFIRHVLDKHFGMFKVQCKICHKSISRADNLERHKSKYHSGSQRGKP
ncbi:hypothetical protein IW261DRAFT_1419555 [Armillaria novae-zelandiae]|uniref:C2H2-type domain-containing protein n=1 Tax=Armillaria novae-zelandiae TaxID=153914 RepID=A0AA39UIL7_9AGAR|nr:hypothetical protein IW261DRAFT_1419555 [Armillaria novae-zelandiae]